MRRTARPQPLNPIIKRISNAKVGPGWVKGGRRPLAKPLTQDRPTKIIGIRDEGGSFPPSSHNKEDQVEKCLNRDYDDRDYDYMVVVPTADLVSVFTGEKLGRLMDFDDEKMKQVRGLVDWKKSLEYAIDKMGGSQAREMLLAVYRIAYWDFPKFQPGFLTEKAKIVDDEYRDRDDEDRDPYRGLSNTNKVPFVVLKNHRTGEFVKIDKRKARISRMRRRVFAWADTMSEYLRDGKRYRKVMITLTYEGVDDWRPNQIRDYMKNLKRRLKDGILGYALVGELQKRGAVHYHLIIVVKKGVRVPTPDKSGMWRYGSSRIETARSVYYICTYLGKEYQKIGVFPKGMRMFSVWISSRLLTKTQKWMFRLSTAPRCFVKVIQSRKEYFGMAWGREEGGGFWLGDERYRSPYVFHRLSVD